MNSRGDMKSQCGMSRGRASSDRDEGCEVGGCVVGDGSKDGFVDGGGRGGGQVVL